MSSHDIQCECTCEQNDVPSGLVISDVASRCCSTRTHELSNNNNLQITVTELPIDITSFAPGILNQDLGLTCESVFYNSYSDLKEHIPKAEIPILNSSLLI